MVARRLAAGALAAALCACGPNVAATLEHGLSTVGLCETCAPGKPKACPAGQSAFPSQRECAPVGATCAAPFALEASGWGCGAVLPTSPCTQATREVVGSASCVPIGDCAAPFPPADATIFVDDSFTATDATHFRSIGAAANAAPAGAVIAIEEGTYPEPIIAPFAPLTLVGRCAEKVRVTNSGGNQVGLYADGVRGIVARGITITGHAGGVFADFGELTLEDSVIDGNAAVGVFAKNGSIVTVRRSRISNTRYVPAGELGAGVVSNTGSQVKLEDVALTANDHRGASTGGQGSVLSCTRCVVARSRAGVGETEPAAGLLAVDNAVLSVTESVVHDVDGTSVYAERANATVISSVLTGTRGRLADGDGLGVFASRTARVLLSNSTVADHPVIALYVDGAGTVLDVVDSTVRGLASVAATEVGRGAQVTTGGRLTAKNLAVFRTASAALAFQNAASGELDRVAIREVREIGWPTAGFLYGGWGLLCEEMSTCAAKTLSIEKATLSGLSSTGSATSTLEDLAVLDTQRSTSSGGGNAGQVANAARLTVRRGYFGDNRTTGFIVVNQGLLTMTAGTVADTLPAEDGSFGHGITVFRNGNVRLEQSLLLRHPGVALVADEAQAQVLSGEISGSSVALHVQNGSYLAVSDSDTPLATGEVRVSNATAFKDNQTRVGVGVVPLPTP